MDILSPVNHSSEVAALHEAGATEVYCGLMREETLKEYTNVFSLNSRHVTEANLSTFDQLRDIVKEAHSRGMKVFVTYNAIYSPRQLEAVIAEAAQTIGCGVDGVIVADISLMLHFAERHPETPVIISTLAGAFNSRTCNVYAGLGARRITLPRHLSVDEIRAVATACPDMKFEVFAMSERCYFPNSLCNFSHATYRVRKGAFSVAANVAKALLGRHMAFLTGTYNNRAVNALQDYFVASNGMQCCRRYSAELIDTEGKVIESGLDFRFMDIWNNFREACGLCALYDIADIENVVSVKIVGRQSLTSKKRADTEMLTKALALLDGGITRDEFTRKAIAIRKSYYPYYCGPGFCYYNKPDQTTSISSEPEKAETLNNEQTQT